MRNVLPQMHRGLAWIIIAAVGAQFFFAGLGLFTTAGFGAHRLTGSLIVPASLILLVLALVGRLGGALIGLSALLLGLTIIQSLLTKGPPFIAALHPVNAVVILFVALNLARYGTRRGAQSPAVAMFGRGA
ncbi:MAG: DUF6220 domain-containing protein [Chloroflexota bacterium]|nr:DUF6220 domain-containing protein [Chloroflexota bacterium]